MDEGIKCHLSVRLSVFSGAYFDQKPSGPARVNSLITEAQNNLFTYLGL